MKKLILLWAILPLFVLDLMAVEPTLTVKDLSSSPAIVLGAPITTATGAKNLIRSAAVIPTSNYTVEVRAKVGATNTRGLDIETQDANRKGFRLAIGATGLFDYNNAATPTTISSNTNSDSYHTFRYAVEGTNVHTYRDGTYLSTQAINNPVTKEDLGVEMDGGFETANAMTNWSGGQYALGTSPTISAHSGSQAVTLQSWNTTSWFASYTINGLRPNTGYDLAYWVKFITKSAVAANQRFDLQLGYYDGSTFIRVNAPDEFNPVNGLPTNTTDAALATWTQYHKYFQTPPNATVAILKFCGWTGTAKNIIDDITLTQANDNSTISSQGSNLLLIPGFEGAWGGTGADAYTTYPTSWGSWRTNIASTKLGLAISSDVTEGSKATKLFINANTAVNTTRALGSYGQQIAASPNERYLLTFDAKSTFPTTIPAFAQIDEVSSGDVLLKTSISKPIPITGAYQSYSIDYTTLNPSCAKLRVSFEAYYIIDATNSYELIVDNTSLKKQTTTFTPYLDYGKAAFYPAGDIDIAYINYDLTGAFSPQNNVIAASASGNGSVSGAATYTSGATVSLTATPTNGTNHFVNWTESSTVVSTNATYSFTATANRTLVANFEPNTVPVSSGITNASSITCTTCDVTIASGGELTIGADKTLKSVTVAAGGKLTITAGSLSTTSGITLESDATGTASLIDSYSTPTVNATVKQYVEAGRNWYMSSPISAAPYTTLSRGTGVVEWNEVTNHWDDVITGNLVKGKGYVQLAKINVDLSVTGSTGTVDFSGTTNSGDVPVTLSRTESGSSIGFNLVGNPYPSYLDWVKVAVANTNVLPTTWFRTKTAGGAYTFATVNVASYLDINDNSPVPVISNGNAKSTITTYIPPMQAYWVRLNANPTKTEFKVTNAMRDHCDNAGNKYKAPKQNTQQLLRLQVSNGIDSDEAVIYFNTNASNAFDVYDSPKMSNGSASIPEIFTLAGNEQLVINGLKGIQYDTELPIGFTTGQSNTFTLKASQFSNFEAGTQVILKDYLDINSPAITNLSDGSSYSFTSDATLNNTSRFTLTFKAPSIATGINGNNDKAVWISTNANGQLMINGKVGNGAKIEVFNSVGQKILSRNLTNSNALFNNTLVAGAYLVKLTNEGKSITKKVIID